MNTLLGMPLEMVKDLMEESPEKFEDFKEYADDIIIKLIEREMITNNEFAKVAKLNEWATEKGVTQDKTMMHSFGAAFNNGIIATEEIEKDDTLIFVPTDACIYAEKVKSSNEVKALLAKEKSLPDRALMAVYLIAQA